MGVRMPTLAPPVLPRGARASQEPGPATSSRSTPQPTDAKLSWFFKAHVNRFGAACVFGRRGRFAKLEAKQTELLERALSMPLIDCEQSL